MTCLSPAPEGKQPSSHLPQSLLELVRLSGKTLANLEAALADALRAVGALPEDDPKVPRSGAWIDFLDHAGSKFHAANLSRFVAYCGNRGIEPTEVTDAVMAEFRAHLDARLIAKDPAKLCKEMAQTWNGIVKRNSLLLATLSYERGSGVVSARHKGQLHCPCRDEFE